MVKLRTEDALGYFSAQMLGRLALPFVTVAEQQRVIIGGSRKSGKTADLAEVQRRFLESEPPRVLPLLGGFVDRSPTADTQTTTYDGADRLWWLSYAADERGCAGVAIVHLTGEQTEERAAELARARGLEPAGDWQIAAIPVPDEERDQFGSVVNTFLAPAELEARFQAKAIKTWEEENPGKKLDLSEIGVLETVAPTLRRCACSRLVPESEWVYPYDCCSDCAEDAASAGDHWREYWWEQDRLRLLGEFTD